MKKRQKNPSPYSVYVRHAIDYIFDHLHEPLKMEELAAAEGLNPSYFSRLFAREVGQTVKAYILSVKIRTAAHILRNSEYPISDISLSLGFSSQSAFTAAFRKLTGETPASYRKHQEYIPISLQGDEE